MKKLRCMLAFILLLSMICALLPGYASEPAAAHTDLSQIADGGTVIGSDGKSYTVLKTPQTMLERVKADMNGSYILGADMDMNGEEFAFPMFGGGSFGGIFDGNGYAILNFSMASSVNANNGLLFHSLTGTPTLRNLTVGSAQAHISAHFTAGNAESIGGIAGSMKNTEARTALSGVTVYADILYSDVRDNTVMIGGMIGKAAPCSIFDCRFYGSVVFDQSAAVDGKNTFVGGMIGRHNSVDGTVSISGCSNFASFDITPRRHNQYTRAAVGGMIGGAEYPIRVFGCSNSGALISPHQSGGIVGSIKGTKNTAHDFSILYCSNSGSITAGVSAGGMIGEASCSGGVSESLMTVEIKNSSNIGSISVQSTDEELLKDGNCGAGGMMGRAFYGYYTVENCYSNAVINCPGKMGSNASTAAGIFGYIYLNSDAERLSSVTNCYVAGELVIGKSTYVSFGVAVISSNSKSKGYLLTVADCYYDLSEGSKTSDVGNGMLSAASVRYGAKTAEAFASGEVLALLGDAFEQTVGSDAYPRLKQPEPEQEAPPRQLENRFPQQGLAGYYNSAGTLLENAAFLTSEPISVTEGQVLTVGALRAEQPSQGHLFAADGGSMGALRMTVAEALAGSYCIYSYTVPAGVASVAVTIPASRAYLALLTLDQPFLGSDYYGYFGISEMSGSADSYLWQKRALYAGDSISYGYSDTVVGGQALAWAGRIAYHYDMEYVNASVSGATLTDLTQNRILPQLTPYLQDDFDYIILEGGVNDANPSYCNAPVGEMSESRELSDFDPSTYAGALDELLCTVRMSYPYAAVGFIITYRMPRQADITQAYAGYIEVTKQICEKWDVDILDLYNHTEINETVLDTDGDTYLKDGIHPNAAGYERLYPHIAAFMNDILPPVQGEPDDPVQPPSDTGSGQVTQEPPSPGAPSTEAEGSTAEPATQTAPATSAPAAGCASATTGGAVWLLLAGCLMILVSKQKNKIQRRISK